MRMAATLLLIAAPLAASIGGMQVDHGTLTAGVSTGNVSVSSMSFTPKAVLFYYTTQTTGNAVTIVSNIAFGAATSTSSRAAWYHRHANGSTVSWSRHTGAGVLTVTDNSGTVILAADLVSFNSNGFTINISTSPGANFLIRWVAWGGVDVTANLLQFDSPTSAVSTPYTGLGFKPDALIFISAGMTAAIPTSDGNSRPGIGFVDTALNQAGFGMKQVNGANTSRRSQSTSSAIYIPDTSAMWVAGNVTSLDSDGFTVNYTTVQSSAVHLWALGFRGLRSSVGPLTQNTSTGSQSTTAVECTPRLLLLGSFCRASGTGQQNDGVISFGAATSGAQGNAAFATSTGTNNSGQATYDNQILTCMTAGTPTTDSQASFTSFDARGFTINNGTVDATARQLVYMTFSPLPLNRMLITSWFWGLPTWLSLPSTD